MTYEQLNAEKRLVLKEYTDDDVAQEEISAHCEWFLEKKPKVLEDRLLK